MSGDKYDIGSLLLQRFLNELFPDCDTGIVINAEDT